MSAEAGLFVCDADQLVDGGRGIRFPVLVYGQPATGFVVRFAGKPYAYLNRCAHVPIELDWKEGDFFESSGLYLMCATHGAVYEPESGRCAGGPCRGGRLLPIGVVEQDGKIFWQPDQQIRAPL
ncbi:MULTISPECIES: Rieske 2Fe-2S domain-containing protein [unclassified Massilia]|uniref:Rieske (2Fe-2S) protein n=1 Tax=unclassified Massilia TaxID=2609279 RepID=UPI001B83DC35|nr:MULTISPECIES: Rieske 2Fe-2S domain-containing protein [unclassified Massilia]MBQ5939654.1 Rieske 2Fe-2S domain-containing protein [Massilia sp. AB1]MBQ5963389.1 Rieske 2Fe-2S domain-containing protein [Massilia sp. ZL223]